MKKTTTLKSCIAFLVLLCCGTLHAQSTFTHLTAYDTITQTPDTLHWFVPAPAANAYGDATITVYYQGDFGASSEDISIVDESGNTLGVTRPYADGSDCMADSVTFTFNASLISGWAADDTLKFSGITSSAVDLFCTANHARLLVTYHYCPVGPVAMLSSAATSICSGDGLITLTSSPAGGTFSGTNVSGAGFNPEGLAPATYTLTYSYTNASGCASYSNVAITINEGAAATASTDTVCPGNGATLTATGNGHLVWYSDASLTMPLDTGAVYTTPALSATTTYYAATTFLDDYFRINSFSTADSASIDHDSITGDDRGGIAVTHNYIYMVGDDSTGRFDLDLGNATRLPRMDGLLSDLKTGQLYTLYNPATGMPDADSTSMVITQLRTLNDDLTLGAGTLTLSDSIPFGYDSLGSLKSGVFAGYGFTIIYSGPTHTWYVIDMQDGVVTNLGTLATPTWYPSETWANYGVGEFDGTSYSVLYRDFDQEIARRVLPDHTPTVAFPFTDVSDMASFTYAPWNHRLYLHYEGPGQFGGTSETLAYMTATDSTNTAGNSATLNCAAAVTITVDVCTDIKEKAKGAMSIYPNPNNGVFTIGFSDNMANSKVEIISMEGRLVYSATLKGAQATKEVDLTNLAKGLYYVRISNDVDVLTEKLVKY